MVRKMAGFLRIRDRRGTTAIEFALVLPVFAFLIFGIADMGRYFFVQQTLQFATREGARLAMVGGTLNGANGTALSLTQSIVQEVQNEASLAVNPSQVQISIFPITSTYGNPTGWTGEQSDGNPGDYMRIVTTYTYTFFTPLISTFFSGGTTTITAQATYRNELFGS
ncbi:MAG: TadE/TadG family type IV pilus assembly protein [Syntrophorhabdales bacterium]|jgi:Flp pilus assembly protein TadG